MSRARTVLVALAAVVMVSGVVGAATSVVSIHTTANDFNTGSPNGFDVEGSGTSAQLAWRGGDTGAAVSLSDDFGTFQNRRVGIEFSPNRPLHGVEFTHDSNADTVYILDASGTVVAQQPLSSSTATITAPGTLDAGQIYYLAVERSGGVTTTAVVGTGSTAELNVTGDGYANGAQSTGYAITSIAGITAKSDTTYVSAAHDADEPVVGFVDLSAVADAKATVTWQGFDGTSWVDVASQTYTTAGNKSLALSGGYSQWRVRVAATETAIDTYDVVIADEGVTAPTAAPSVDNATASPQGNPTLSSAPTLSVDGTDADFATTQGDTVTVRWFVDGSQVATTTETANGTWSYDPETTAGSTQWRVEVTDSYGHTTQSQTFSFTTPAELEIYNESAPNSLINGAEVEIRYFFDESDPQNSLVVTRTTNDGTVDMSGLPADKPFVVVAKADGYQSRRIYVKSLFATQQIYLLPDAEESVTVTFDLQDYSGEFPQENTVLIIQRALDDKYETVHADRFGAAGEFPATLRFGARHRLIVRNTETGAERVVGPYTPIVNTQQTITVQSQGDPTLATDVRVTMKPGLRQVQNGSAVSVTASIASDAGRLDSYQVRYLVKEPASTQTATLATATGTQPTGETISETLDLTGRAGAQLLVVVEYTMTDGTTHTETVRYRITDSYGSQIGLLPTLESMPTLLADGTTDMVTTLISVVAALAMLASAASLGASTEAVGITGVVTLAGFGVIGWVGYGLVFAAGGAWVAMSALRRVV
jgi:hypothetical protein